MTSDVYRRFARARAGRTTPRRRVLPTRIVKPFGILVVVALATAMVPSSSTRLAERNAEIATAGSMPLPTPARTTRGPVSTSRPEGRVARASRSGSASLSWRSTQASWYDHRPSSCHDARGSHAVPSGLHLWSAHRSLPCGTAVRVEGPAGALLVRVYDRGPYVDGRDLDLSTAAFRGVCGALSAGVCRVRYAIV